jgi:hypothetical protein
MPVVSRFYGIIIRMFYRDHLPPHFHVEHGEYELVVEINPIRIKEGKAPNRVRSMVLEWAALHQQELLDNWHRCRTGQAPLSIESLE